MEVSGLRFAPPRDAGQPTAGVGHHHRAERADHARGRLEGVDPLTSTRGGVGIERVEHGDVQPTSRAVRQRIGRRCGRARRATERRTHRPDATLAQLEHRLGTDPRADASRGCRQPSAAGQAGQIGHGGDEPDPIAGEPATARISSTLARRRPRRGRPPRRRDPGRRRRSGCRRRDVGSSSGGTPAPPTSYVLDIVDATVSTTTGPSAAPARSPWRTRRATARRSCTAPRGDRGNRSAPAHRHGSCPADVQPERNDQDAEPLGELRTAARRHCR